MLLPKSDVLARDQILSRASFVEMTGAPGAA